MTVAEPCGRCKSGHYEVIGGATLCAACGRPVDPVALVRDSVSVMIEARAEKLLLEDRPTAVILQALASDVRAGLDSPLGVTEVAA